MIIKIKKSKLYPKGELELQDLITLILKELNQSNLNSPHLEKDPDTKIGTFYYDVTTDSFRGKTKKGWVTLNN